MSQQKVTRNDLIIQEGKINVQFIEVDGKRINLTPSNHSVIENFITHENCENCGNEFKKDFTYQKKCNRCTRQKEVENYFKLDLVEWNKEDALSLYKDDVYFFNEDEILDYCYENELKLEELHLVTCSESSFSPLDLQNITEEVTHEDWEPSKEFMDKFNEFNKWLISQSTSTHFPTNKRVNISKYLTLDPR